MQWSQRRRQPSRSVREAVKSYGFSIDEVSGHPERKQRNEAFIKGGTAEVQQFPKDKGALCGSKLKKESIPFVFRHGVVILNIPQSE